MSYKTEISKLLKADFKFRKNKSYEKSEGGKINEWER